MPLKIYLQADEIFLLSLFLLYLKTAQLLAKKYHSFATSLLIL